MCLLQAVLDASQGRDPESLVACGTQTTPTLPLLFADSCLDLRQREALFSCVSSLGLPKDLADCWICIFLQGSEVRHCLSVCLSVCLSDCFISHAVCVCKNALAAADASSPVRGSHFADRLGGGLAFVSSKATKSSTTSSGRQRSGRCSAVGLQREDLFFQIQRRLPFSALKTGGSAGQTLRLRSEDQGALSVLRLLQRRLRRKALSGEGLCRETRVSLRVETLLFLNAPRRREWILHGVSRCHQ